MFRRNWKYKSEEQLYTVISTDNKGRIYHCFECTPEEALELQQYDEYECGLQSEIQPYKT